MISDQIGNTVVTVTDATGCKAATNLAQVTSPPRNLFFSFSYILFFFMSCSIYIPPQSFFSQYIPLIFFLNLAVTQHITISNVKCYNSHNGMVSVQMAGKDFYTKINK